MRWFFVCTFVWMVGCGSQQKQPSQIPQVLKYKIQPTKLGKRNALLVELDFLANPDGKTVLVLPSEWASEKDLYKDVQDLQVTGAEVSDGDKPFLKILSSRPGQPLSVRYKIVPSEAKRGNPARALVTPEYFYFNGYSVFVYPEDSGHERESTPVEISLSWQDFPANYALANSFGAHQTEQHLQTSIANLKDSIYAGGDFRIYEERVRDRSAFIALRGKWKFSDMEYREKLKRVIEFGRGYFNDDDFSNYFVVTLPNGHECCISGGSGFYNAFAMYLPAEAKVDGGLVWTFAHEFFHTWNGGKIRQPAEHSELIYWFSEGFTSYFARLLILRDGMTKLSEYIQDYNRTLFFYTFSTAQTIPNARIEKEFWTDSDVGKIPYYRGDMLAHRWNLRLKNAGSSLDAPMRDYFAESQTLGTRISAPDWNRQVARYLKGGVEEDIKRFVEDGEVIPLDPEALGPCVKLQFKNLKWDDPHHNPNNPSPHHRPNETRRVPQYVLDQKKFRSDPQACLTWFK